MIDLRPLIQPSYWFNNTPPAFGPGAVKTLFIFFAAFLVLGAVIRMVAGRRKEDRHVTETFNRLGRMGVSMGLLGLLIFFFSFEQVPFLGARFWYLFWGIGLIIWISTIVHYVVKIVPMERAHEIAQREKEKYLPKKK